MERAKQLKPFMSVIFIIISFLLIAFLQMEERRIGYEVLRLANHQRQAIELHRLKKIELAKMNRPQNIERLALAKLSLKRVHPNQIIHLSGVTR
jgi:hypothetical protein